MKTGINTENLTASGAIASGALLGAMASRVVASKLGSVLEKQPIIKHGALVVAGVIAACFIDPKNTTSKVLQGVGVGVAATQLNEVFKIMLKPKDKEMEAGIIKTALGAPDEQPIYITQNSGDYYPYEEVANPYDTSVTPTFLSGVDMNGFAQV